MSGKDEIGQDFFCLVIGIITAFISSAGLYTIKFLWDRKDVYFSKRQSSADKTRKTLKFQALPSISTSTSLSKQDQDKKKLRASMSPSSLFQNYQANKSNSGPPISRPKEVEVTLDIKRKGKATDQNFDVDLGIVVDPDSKKPMDVKVKAQVDKDTMKVNGKAYSEAEGSVKIKGQAENANGERKEKRINLRTNVKSGESQKMVLRSGKKK